MSQSIEEIAQEHTERAAALRRIARKFPSAELDVLWDDGPRVPVCYQRDALTVATGVHVAIERGRAVLLPYVEMGPKGARARCYVLPLHMHERDAQTVIDRLDLASTLAAMKEER